jgi:Domain of unknown function (DUF4132)
MAFTIEQIEGCLDSYNLSNRQYYEPDFTMISDYLVGKTSALLPFQNNYISYLFHPMVALLNEPENFNANDSILLDVIGFDALYGYLFYDKIQPKVKVYNKILFYLHKFKLTDTQKFDFLLEHFNDHGSEEAMSSDLYQFMKNYLEKLSDAEIQNYIKSKLNISDNFNPRLVKALEVWRPNYVETYLFEIVFRKDYYFDHSAIQYLIELDNNKHFRYLVDLINSKKVLCVDKENIFTACNILYVNNKEAYLNEFIKLCEETLQHKENTANINRRETTLMLNINGEESYVPISCYALLTLLDTNKELHFPRVLSYSNKVGIKNIETLTVLEEQLKERAIPLLVDAFKVESFWNIKEFYSGVLQLLQKYDGKFYVDDLWQYTTHKTKTLRELIAAKLCQLDEQALPKAIALLEHKKADQRQLAAFMLGIINTNESITALQNALNNETNDDARDVMLAGIDTDLFQYKNIDEINIVIQKAAERKKLQSPAKWLILKELPALYLKDGSACSEDLVHFILYRMSRIKEMKADTEVKTIFNFIDKDKATPFAKKILQLFFDNGAEAKYKYILALVALIGNDDIVDKLKTNTIAFADGARNKMAEYTVGALAIHGSDKALRWVEFFSRKYKSKRANVGVAALAALEIAAAELNISTHELGDKIVPNFGFDGLFKSFEVGSESYRAFIDSNFKMAYFNEDNKKLKAIPSAADAELVSDFKAIAKEVRDIVKSQTPRLEYYLIIQRKWSVVAWQSFYLENPVMFIYATKLLWGQYDEQGNLQSCFICLEDTSLIDIDKNEIELDESLQIGIVYPTQLKEAEKQAWEKIFFKEKIDPMFAQLSRPIPNIEGIDLDTTILTKYEGKKMATGSIRSTLEKYGWHKGGTGDGGYLESMNLLYQEKNIEAVMELDGVGVGYGWGTEEKLGRLYVIDKIKLPKRYYGYRKSTDDFLVNFKDLPQIFLTEIFAALGKIKPAE